jgi:hypothetical protein
MSSFCAKILLPKNYKPKLSAHKRCAKNFGMKKLLVKYIVEIDSHTKVLCTAFKCLQFGFVIFWRKDFGTKAAHKMLVKFTQAIQLNFLWP